MKKTWIKIKRGLVDPKYRQTMGIRIWLYIYMLDKVDWETGKIWEWRDKHEAEDYGMAWRTLQEHRQQLENDGYISCLLKGDHQEITIKNWTNPREYGGEVYNEKSKGTDKPVQPKKRKGTGKGTGKGSRKPRTPSLDSQNTNHIEHPPIPTFTRMSMKEIRKKYPSVAHYEAAIGEWPGTDLLGAIWLFYFEHPDLLNKDPQEMRRFFTTWKGRGYNPNNIVGWLEWVITGVIPPPPGKRNNGQYKTRIPDEQLESVEDWNNE